MLGVTLNYYFYPDSDEWTRLKSLVEGGCTLQILILDPNSPQVFNKRRRACPTMEFMRSKDGIFESYLEHFNDLWKKAENTGMKGTNNKHRSSLQ